MYAASGLYRTLQRMRHRAVDPGFWVLFGDSAFPASEHCHKILPNATEAWKKSYNKSMSKLRISAEWMTWVNNGHVCTRLRPIISAE